MSRAAGLELGLALADLDVAEDLVELHLRDERTVERIGLLADTDLLDRLDVELDEL